MQKDDLSREKGLNYEYADDEVVDKVIGLLREKLGEDKVTTGDDERSGHGLSPNTYHSLFFFTYPHFPLYIIALRSPCSSTLFSIFVFLQTLLYLSKGKYRVWDINDFDVTMR